MKSKNYTRLKINILLQTMLVVLFTALVGYLFKNLVIDGIYNHKFADGFVHFFMWFHMPEQQAIDFYWKVIGNNKIYFMGAGFLLLFSFFFYFVLSRITQYLKEINQGIENILSDFNEPVRFKPALRPLEDSLNEIKMTIRRQEQEAIESEKKKNDLVVFLAHDLKTPLTSIVAYLSILETKPDMPEEERKKYTHISLEKAIRLGELINEFFEITKFNLQDIVLEPGNLDLSMMLEQIADELYAVLKEKNLRCDVQIDDTLMIYGDADKLARVFDNLLRNAIAYCDKGTAIRIQAKERHQEIEIVVANEGEKIPEEELSAIFEKFYRVDGSRSSKTGGAGLGLAIAKEIVELHHGTIRAESDEWETRFIVTLPAMSEGE
ncbi:sensor histidine kinase [Faecalimonas umbilicata]|uniref:sensor histidine kinase n=1 Tax=Faecalimonas umbilicata TaxID=1912855 RepID=UPI002A834AF0|nr:HAMP domain-containing sensor histidine kinase [Faecalimonas umbilicata]MDY4597166.1 HAMP domain-containing sensor histidine kinase [Faecalimonas umbilicata]